MNIQSMSVSMEKYVTPLANKPGNGIHLRAIRDTFMSLLPITFTGGTAAVLSSTPSVDTAGAGITLVWARFVENSDMIFSWINALTLRAMSLYVYIRTIYFLCKSRKIESFLPVLLGICGFLMLIVEPVSPGWDGEMAELSYMDSKGLVPAMSISILTADLYYYIGERDFGKVSLPGTMPVSLSGVFASIIPGAVLMVIYITLYAITNKAGTTLPKSIYNAISPSLTAADNVGFTIIITLMIHIFWFFGIHDAALSGMLAPIHGGDLSISTAAHAAGQTLPSIFTTPFWVYFVVIRECGSVLALTTLLCFSKSRQLKAIGGLEIVLAFFSISGPAISSLPPMLSPVFSVPFLLTSIINDTATYLTMQVGLVGKSPAMLSWQMPPVIGAFLSTINWKMPLLILVLIVVDGLVYFPLLKIYEKDPAKLESGEEGIQTMNVVSVRRGRI